ncbi:hypothetical protein [Bacillus mycoides]|uniref:hypothetical protein n=1 Tax=Bacillus mycoides TaxID=1405 RepID=UPI00366AA26C
MKVVSKTKKFEVIHEMTKNRLYSDHSMRYCWCNQKWVLQMDKTAYDAFKKTIRGYRN